MKLIVLPKKGNLIPQWPNFKLVDANGRMLFGGSVHISAIPMLTAMMYRASTRGVDK